MKDAFLENIDQVLADNSRAMVEHRLEKIFPGWHEATELSFRDAVDEIEEDWSGNEVGIPKDDLGFSVCRRVPLDDFDRRWDIHMQDRHFSAVVEAFARDLPVPLGTQIWEVRLTNEQMEAAARNIVNES